MDYDEVVADLKAKIEPGHNYIFIGKVGSFCPMKPGCTGGLLLREVVDKKTGIDRGYYDAMVDAAVADISQYGDFEWFVSDDPYVKADDDTPPWFGPGEPYGDDATAFDVR